MITNPSLLLVVQYVDAMTGPLYPLEVHEQLTYQLAYSQISVNQDDIQGIRLVRLLDEALQSYFNLDDIDMEDLPLHVHLWFIENAARRQEKQRARPQQLTELYAKVNMPLVRYAIVKTLARSYENNNWFGNILESVQKQLQREELAMILLDLRLYRQLRLWIVEYQAEDIKTFLLPRLAYISGNNEARALLEELNQ